MTQFYELIAAIGGSYEQCGGLQGIRPLAPLQIVGAKYDRTMYQVYMTLKARTRT